MGKAVKSFHARATGSASGTEERTELNSRYHSHRGDVDLITPSKRRNKFFFKKRQAGVTPIKRLLISVNNPDREIVKWLS